MAGSLLDRVRHIEVPQFSDPRGLLFALERLRPLPFTPIRTCIITDVPPGQHRAEHVVSCDEFLWMAIGACQALVREAKSVTKAERRFQLSARESGLYVPTGVWLDLSDFIPDSILVCLAAANHDAQIKR